MERNNGEPKLERIQNKRISGMSRRRFMNSLLSAGFGVATASYLTVEDVKAAGRNQIPVVEGFSSDDPEKPVESFTAKKRNVPADWYNDLQHARIVNRQIRSTYGERDGIIGFGVSAGDFGGENASVQVDVLPAYIGEMGGIIPETVDDVPVEVNESSEITPDGCNTGDFHSSVPGGVRAIGNSSQGYGTMLSRMYDNRGRRRFATAKHLFRGTNSNGASLWHPSKNRARVGKVVRTHCYDDFVLAVERNGHYPQRRIEDANPERVNGQFSRDGVNILKAGDKRVKKVGCRTCKTRGRIHSANYTHFGYGCTPKYGQVRWGSGSDSNDGDSGAPVYHLSTHNSSYQWIVSIDLWSGSDAAGGTGAWRIKNRHNYHF